MEVEWGGGILDWVGKEKKRKVANSGIGAEEMVGVRDWEEGKGGYKSRSLQIF